MHKNIPPGVAVGAILVAVVVAFAIMWRAAMPEKSDKPFDMKKMMGGGKAAPAGANGAPAPAKAAEKSGS